MSHFELKLYWLLWNYPLCGFSTADGKEKRVDVLLVYSAANSDKFQLALHQLLQQGQLPHTSLHLHVRTGNAGSLLRTLRQKAPDLERFVTFTGLPEETRASLEAERRKAEVDRPLAYIHFFRPEELGRVMERCRYAMLLDTKEANRKLAGELPHCGLIAGTGLEYAPEGSPIVINMTEADKALLASFREEMQPYLMNLQRLYDPSSSAAKLRRDLAWDEPGLDASAKERRLYSWCSNMGSALHLKTEVLSLGVSMEEPAGLMEKIGDERTVSELAVLGHNRWVAQKLFSMRQLPDDAFESRFYRDGCTTHGPDWHCCMVPSRVDSALTDVIFDHFTLKTMTPEEKRTLLDELEAHGDLDPLDKISIKVRMAVQSIFKSRENDLWVQLNRLKAEHSGTEETRILLQFLSNALHGMADGSRQASVDYACAMEKLHQSGLPLLEQKLKQLEQLAAPLKEFSERKDYKRPEFVFVRNLPFVLTHREGCVAFKLLDDPETFMLDVYGAWLAMPARVVYLYAQSDRMPEYTKKLKNFWNANGLLHCEFRELDPEQDLVEQMKKLAGEYQPQYLDISGVTSPDLLRACCNVDVPCVTVSPESGFRIEKRSNMEWLQFSIARPLSVNSSLQLAGNQSFGSTAERNRLLLDGVSVHDVRSLWLLRQKYRTAWDSLCEGSVNPLIANCQGSFDLEAADRVQQVSCSIASVNRERIERALDMLGRRHLVHSCSILRTNDDSTVIVRYTSGLPCQDGKTYLFVSFELLRQIAAFVSRDDYTVTGDSIAEQRFVVFSESLIRSVSSTPEIRTLLKELQNVGAVASVTERNGYLQYKFVNLAFLSLFSAKGQILEMRTYKEAQQVLYSVEHSVKFYRSSGRAEAELDVVATPRDKKLTLFISCKDVLHNTYASAYLQEIRFNAEHYGLNGVPILVTTGDDTFVFENDRFTLSVVARSFQAKSAYFIGRDLIQKDLLGKALTSIVRYGQDWYRPLRSDLIASLSDTRKEELKSSGMEQETKSAEERLVTGSVLNIPLIEAYHPSIGRAKSGKAYLFLTYNGQKIRKPLASNDEKIRLKSMIDNKDTIQLKIGEFQTNSNTDPFYFADLL